MPVKSLLRDKSHQTFITYTCMQENIDLHSTNARPCSKYKYDDEIFQDTYWRHTSAFHALTTRYITMKKAE